MQKPRKTQGEIGMHYDTEGFSRYLLRCARVNKRELPFYLKWVEDFFTLFPEGCNDRAVGIEKFKAELARRWQDWQVLQALSALRHYWYYTDRQQVERLQQKSRKSEHHIDEVEDQSALIVEDVQRILRLTNRSYRTERSYVGWLQRFCRYLQEQRDKKVTPSDLTEEDVKSYLTYLAVEKRVAAATQQQAFNALLFVYRHVLGRSISGLSETIRARKPQRLPVVLSPTEVGQLIKILPKPYHLMCMIIYGGGLRLSECLALRIRDLDFDEDIITVRSGKGNKDRTTLFPRDIHTRVRELMRETRLLFDEDRRRNRPGVPLPNALARKYPAAAVEWGWYWLFPSPRSASMCAQSDEPARYRLNGLACTKSSENEPERADPSARLIFLIFQ